MRQVPEWEAISLLDRLGAVMEGHFIGKSGNHLSAYVAKDVPTRYPESLRVFAEGIAWMMKEVDVDIIVGPPMGALAVAVMVAEELKVEYAYLDRIDDDTLEVKRAPFKEGVAGRRVGIVEDIFTTGKTSGQSTAAVRAAGGEVVFVVGIYNRGGLTAKALKVPYFGALVNRDLPDWTPEDCLVDGLCAQSVPIRTDYGHGAEARGKSLPSPGGYI